MYGRIQKDKLITQTCCRQKHCRQNQSCL